MNRKTVSLTLGLPLAFALGSLARTPTHPLAPQGPAAADAFTRSLAVVDVGRVRQGYPRARDLDETWQRDKAEVDQRLQKTKEALDKLQLELQGWDPFTPQWIAAQTRVNAAEASLNGMRDLEKRRLLMRRLEDREKLYHDIDRAVSELAVKRNLKLVLRILPDVPEGEPLDSRVAMWATRSVLYHHDTLDLTEDVIDFLKSPAFSGNDPPKPENGK